MLKAKANATYAKCNGNCKNQIEVYCVDCKWFYCMDCAKKDHLEKGKFHIWQQYDNQLDILGNYVGENRIVRLKKSCNKLSETDLKTENFILIGMRGHLKLNLIRKQCDCCKLIDDLIFNKIYPGSPIKISIKINFRCWIYRRSIDISPRNAKISKSLRRWIS